MKLANVPLEGFTKASIKTFIAKCDALRAIWYHLHNFKKVKNTHGGVLFLVKLSKSKTPPWVFFKFFTCTNGTKSRKASQILRRNKNVSLYSANGVERK